MSIFLALVIPLLAGALVGLIIHKRCKTAKQKLLATMGLTVVVVLAAGLGVVFILFSAASRYSAMMEIDDERWFNAENVVSANFSEAKPLRGACPKPSSPDFDRQVRSKLCSIIIACNDGNQYLFVGWQIRNRPREAGTNITGAVQDIGRRWGSLSGPNSTFFAHGSCFDPVAYFHGSGPDLGGGEEQHDQDRAAQLKLITEILRRNDPKPEIPIPDQYWRDVGITPTDEQRKQSANALTLSNSQAPELLVENIDPDGCGSSGCTMNIYGLRSTAAQGSKSSFQYKLLLESHGGPDGVHILDSTTNGYRDLLIDGNYGASLLKFNGTSYEERECFSHEHNDSSHINSIKCSTEPTN
jgi:hypothetical protein